VKVRVLFFAAYREVAGTPLLELELPPGATVDSVVQELRGRLGLSSLPAEPAVALNETYVPLGTPVAEGDEVALIPPVAGG